MIKYLSTFCFLILSLTLFGQRELIASQGFEDFGDTWNPMSLSTPACISGGDTWNRVKFLGGITPSQGDWFWGVEDLNGACGSSGFEWIALPGIGTGSYQDVILSFDLWVEGFDNGDDIEYQLTFDGIEGERMPIVEGASDYSTGGWINVEIPIANRYERVGLKILIKQNGSDQAGIDNIQLRGLPSNDCAEIFISEYIEGSSSSSHRNNYIELYNPTESWVKLDAYALLKFTGSQMEASASLGLQDSISPYGTYLIEDDQEQLDVKADLSTNSSVLNFNGDDKIALRHRDRLIDLIGTVGDSLDFARDITLRRRSWVMGPNSQFDESQWETYGLEDLGDIGRHASTCQGPLPEILISGNEEEIKDGNLTTGKRNNTYFGYLPVEQNSNIIREYTITNTGNAPLQIYDIDLSGPGYEAFNLNDGGSNLIQPGESQRFSISFSPDQMGLFVATLQISNNDPSEGLYSTVISASETTAPLTS